jgi:acyl transferase domain-containing protein
MPSGPLYISAIGHLWLNGIYIDWKAFYALENRQRTALPGYPFEHKSYWLDPPAQTELPTYSSQETQQETITENNSDFQTIAAMSQQRKERLVKEISDILEEASGMELEGADRNAGFVELGLDSLFLTSVALTLTKKYGVKVTSVN